MVNFVLVGLYNCEKTAKVLSILMYLQHHLPDFEYTKRILPLSDWNRFVTTLNSQYNWHIVDGPIVYKELHKPGAKKPILIGGISEFWEYCQEYYNFECLLEGEEVDEIVFEKMRESIGPRTSEHKKSLNIMFYGAAHRMTIFLMTELMEIKQLAQNYSMQFILYDENAVGPEYQGIKELMHDFFEMYGINATHCINLREEIKQIDLLIMLDDTSSLENNENSWAIRNYLLQISFLAEEIMLSHNFNLRIIFANDGMSSLVATFLVNRISVNRGNLVVLSSDLGVSYIAEVSRRSGIKCEKFCAPPVWGSVGYNTFVDIGATLMKCNVRKPFRRAITASPHSTLLHGTIVTEFRPIRYFTDDMTDLEQVVRARRVSVAQKLRMVPIFGKIHALIKLIRIWYGLTPMKEPIMSIGVCSDGSFGIPSGLVFSQPAIMKHGGWVPFPQYPVSQETRERVKQLANEARSYYDKNIPLHMRLLETQENSIASSINVN